MSSPSPSSAYRKKVLRAAVGVLIRLVAIYAIVQISTTVVLVFDARRSDVPMPQEVRALASANGGFDHVVFHASDGVLLRGELLGQKTSRPAVVFGHSYRARRRQGDALAVDFLNRGYAVLLFDFRGCGASDGTFTTVGGREDRDVVGAIRFLEGRGIPRQRVAFVGCSMGAVAALQGAHELNGLAAVVLIAPYARMLETFDARTRHLAGIPLTPTFEPALWLYRLFTGVDPSTVNPIDRIPQFGQVPVLLLGGELDWRAPVSDLTAMSMLRPDSTELLVIEHADHYDLSALTPDIRTPIVDFVTTHLPPGKTTSDRH
jgi:pimeloyl-ACP methyl ester carboxylesterase